MHYKTVKSFLENPTREDNEEFGFDFNTSIHNVKIIKINENIEHLKNVKDLYDFIISHKAIFEKRNGNTCLDAEVLALYHERGYERKEIYSIDEIREATKDVLFAERKTDIILDGDIIKANSQRYQTFFTKGTKCVCCGLEGKFFRKERSRNISKKASRCKPNRYHLNLYGVNKNGHEVLITKDHIIPVSKGGKNVLENYQTMCEICNKRKGNNMEG